ncbi:Serine carboxypeptidase S28 family protein [Hibiscus syriacus]|uniref:Serine carboxypeptidase S28 family protein n=1 Tax=Hibiscus syriacus TaxID=106335 RepID=A0A6A3D4N8_HIBSY|nr:Serine carboxypeptidase S28 family protein [Hibiscus syriacus]
MPLVSRLCRNHAIVILAASILWKSIPLGSREAALRNASVRGYFLSSSYCRLCCHYSISRNISRQRIPGDSSEDHMEELHSFFDDLAPQVGYYAIVTKDFKETSERCYEIIRKSGMKLIRAPKGTDILGRIFAGVVAYMRNKSCYDMDEFDHPTDETYGWKWQTCSEMVIPIGHEHSASMFPPSPFNLNKFIRECKSLFGVQPRPHWVTTYYGGHDLKLILHRFASNIIFSNGLRDPYSSGGVLENISDSVAAVYTVNGSHCLDLLPEMKTDPPWLIKQRKQKFG